jgi:polygalacturonase
MRKCFYNVTEYGIEGNGKKNNTDAIRQLVAAVERNGGGTVCFPPGEYVTGTVALKSNMTLYLEAGAVLLGSENPDDFPMIDSTRIPGWAAPTHAGLVMALNAENVSVRGRGTIDGRGGNWWHKYGDERPRSIEFIGCEDVLIENIRIINSPMWTVHPVCCTNVTIHGITIHNPADSPNTDGINPDGCTGVHISDCTIDVGDDCVTLKSGTQRDDYIRQHPCENITITNCTMCHGHGGVVIGSEMSGGVRNVVISNCVFCGTDRGIRIKTRRLRGGTVEDIRVNNIIMDGVFCPIVVSCFYCCSTSPEDYAFASSPEKQPVRDDTPVFRNLYFSNITVRNAVAAACYIDGLPELPVDGVLLDNFTVGMKQGSGVQPQAPAMTYEAQRTGAKMKGKGMFLRNARNVTMRNVMLSSVEGIGLTMKRCENAAISRFAVCGALADNPVFSFENSSGVSVDQPGAEHLVRQSDYRDIRVNR